MSNDHVNPSHLRLLTHRQNLNFRDLAKRFNVPVDTLKRWSRVFLLLDPNAGRQDGRTRMLTPDESLTLFLAGFLIRNEDYGIADTGQILSDLKPWLLAKRLMPSRIGPGELKGFYELFIQKRNGESFFRYGSKLILAKDRLMKKGGKVTMQESYVLDSIPGQKPLSGIEHTRLIWISILVGYGLRAIDWKWRRKKKKS